MAAKSKSTPVTPPATAAESAPFPGVFEPRIDADWPLAVGDQKPGLRDLIALRPSYASPRFARLIWRSYLDAMEAHYRQVAKLDRSAVERFLSHFDPRDRGRIAYEKVLIAGADPRLELARFILHLIPQARTQLSEDGGAPLLALRQIEDANARANVMLIAKFVKPGIGSALGRGQGLLTRQKKAQERRKKSGSLKDRATVSRTTVWRDRRKKSD